MPRVAKVLSSNNGALTEAAVYTAPSGVDVGEYCGARVTQIHFANANVGPQTFGISVTGGEFGSGGTVIPITTSVAGGATKTYNLSIPLLAGSVITAWATGSDSTLTIIGEEILIG